MFTIHTHTHTHTHTYIHTYIFLVTQCVIRRAYLMEGLTDVHPTYTYIYVYIYIYIHINIYIYVHVYVYIYIYISIHTCIFLVTQYVIRRAYLMEGLTDVHHTYTYTHTHTYIHTYIYIYIYIYIPSNMMCDSQSISYGGPYWCSPLRICPSDAFQRLSIHGARFGPLVFTRSHTA